MKRFFMLFLTVLLCLSFIGCRGNNRGASTSARSDFRSSDPDYANMDLSEFKSISVTYFLNNVPEDYKEVISIVNDRYYKPILNTEIWHNFVPSVNWQTTQALMLAGGEDIDVIMSATWRLYNEEALKGSYIEISQDYINKWLPKSKRTNSPISWEQAKVNGVVYGVPTTETPWEHKFTVIREDLRVKYNLPPITSWDNLENYIFTVSRNEPGVIGYDTAATTWELMNVYMQDRDILLSAQPVYFGFRYQGREPRPEELEFLYTSSWYKDYARAMARWYANGAFSRNVMNQTVTYLDNFLQGRSAAGFWHDFLYTRVGKPMEDNGHGKASYWDIAPTAPARRRAFDSNLWSVASVSSNHERSGLVIDLMKNNADIHRLLKFGIQGRHYVLQADGSWLPGPDATKYPYDQFTGPLGSTFDFPRGFEAGTPQDFIDIVRNLDTRILDMEFDGFRVDITPMAAEWMVMSALIAEYRQSFECGIFGNDTEAKLAEFDQKMRAAGVDRLITMVRGQYTAYLRSIGR